MRRALLFVLFWCWCWGWGCGGGGRKDAVALVNVTPLGAPSAPAPASSPGERLGTSEPPIQIVAGYHFCARVEGRVYCAPLDDLDRPLVQEQHAVAGIDDAIQLVTAQGTMCVATRRGTVQCWGDNSFGQLGAHLRADHSDKPVDVIGVTRVRRLFAGRWHFCAVSDDSSIRCWGRNEQGQTGSDTTYVPEARELVDATEVPSVKGDLLTCGFGFTCARTPSRAVTCWGAVQDYPRAMATGKRSERPTVVEGVADVEHLSSGETAVCAVQQKGTVVCWGEGRRLIAGAPMGTRTGNVEKVPGIENAVRVATWDDHACALLADGRVSCFGFPYSGALGTNADEQGYEAVAPAIVPGVTRATSVSVASGITCALTRDDEVLCWGRWYTERGSRSEPKPVRVRLR